MCTPLEYTLFDLNFISQIPEKKLVLYVPKYMRHYSMQFKMYIKII